MAVRNGLARTASSLLKGCEAAAPGRVRAAASAPFQLQQRPLSSDLTSSPCEGLTVTATDSGVLRLTLDRPSRLNSLNEAMFAGVPVVLSRAAGSDGVRAVVITGRGEYYSSGFDLGEVKKVMKPDGPSPAEFSRSARDLLHNFVSSFIDFPKPLLSAVNGPCLGVMCTTLALCDAVYAREGKATFSCPFARTAQGIEGCASLLFPRILGQSVASDVLLFDRKLSCSEAMRFGLVSEVVEADGEDDFQQKIAEKADKIASLPPGAIADMKRLVRGWEKEELHRVNKAETDLLEKRWQSEEFMGAAMAFLSRKNK